MTYEICVLAAAPQPHGLSKQADGISRQSTSGEAQVSQGKYLKSTG